MEKEKIKIKKYSNMGIFYGSIILLLVILLVAYFIFLGPIQQCASVDICGEAEEYQFVFSWLKTMVSLVIILVTVIILFITPLYGGINERERSVLKHIYNNSDKFVTYQLIKIMRKKENDFRNLDNKQIYRIIRKLSLYGYIEKDKGGKLKITELGKSHIEVYYK